MSDVITNKNRKLKIVVISDTHGLSNGSLCPEPLPKGDILLHAGDITGYNLTTLKEIDLMFESLDFKHKIFIAGNHDSILQNLGKSIIQENLDHCIYLQDDMIEIEGIKIYGTPWTPQFMDWAFMLPSSKLKEKFSLIPNNIDIFLSHGPCFGLGDQNWSGKPLGCKNLLQAMKRIKPKYHIFGHIHSGKERVTTLDNTIHINASICNDDLCFTQKPFVFEI